MEILDKKSNRMSRANTGVFEYNEFPDLQRILDFLSLRNLLSNELLFTFYEFATVPLFFFTMLLYRFYKHQYLSILLSFLMKFLSCLMQLHQYKIQHEELLKLLDIIRLIY